MNPLRYLQLPKPRPRLLHNRTHNLRPFRYLHDARHAFLRRNLHLSHAHGKFKSLSGTSQRRELFRTSR